MLADQARRRRGRHPDQALKSQGRASAVKLSFTQSERLTCCIVPVPVPPCDGGPLEEGRIGLARRQKGSGRNDLLMSLRRRIRAGLGVGRRIGSPLGRRPVRRRVVRLLRGSPWNEKQSGGHQTCNIAECFSP